MVESIVTVDPLLIAHIAAINGDPNGKGMNFEFAATHLILADPVERKAALSNNGKRIKTAHFQCSQNQPVTRVALSLVTVYV